VREECSSGKSIPLEPLCKDTYKTSDPLFQRTLINVVRSNPDMFGSNHVPRSLNQDPVVWSGLPIIFDEVFTGLFRLGVFTPSILLDTQPDISVHAKLLTGGLLPLCATLASNSIYEAFLGDEKAEALLHGHSYTAHAVGCNVARTSLLSMLELDTNGTWEGYKQDWAVPLTLRRGALWSVWERDFVSQISHKGGVESVIALGSVLAVALSDEGGKGYSSNAASGLQKRLLEMGGDESFNIHCRVLGNVLYVMASLVSARECLRKIQKRLMDILE
jgi:dethiobiotin synthetase/adenosylmethionine--8-amino-7-oxononanoate aminotransferase